MDRAGGNDIVDGCGGGGVGVIRGAVGVVVDVGEGGLDGRCWRERMLMAMATATTVAVAAVVVGMWCAVVEAEL